MHMNINDFIKDRIKQRKDTLNNLFDFYNTELISRAIKMIYCSIFSDRKIMIFGNGGSAADSQHMAAEFVNRFLINRKPLAAVALTTDSSVLTSISNDFGYSQIFSKQIEAIGQLGDVAFGLTTSETRII